MGRMEMMSKIAIIYGGPSNEHEVSVSSFKNISRALEKYSPTPLFWRKDGKCELGIGDGQIFESTEDCLKYLSETKCFVVNALHGKFGEDGYIQSLMDRYSIKYSGPSQVAAQNSFDKMKTYELVGGIVGMELIPTVVSNKKLSLCEVLEKLETNLPIFIKPNDSGSSVGTYFVKNDEDYEKFISKTENFENMLYQSYIKGKEFSVGVVYSGGFWDLPVTEIRPGGEYFDYSSKYTMGGSIELTPADLPRGISGEITRYAREVHTCLGLGLYSRSDFLLDEYGKLYFLEVNSLPGMTDTSILPAELKYAGLEEEFWEVLAGRT